MLASVMPPELATLIDLNGDKQQQSEFIRLLPEKTEFPVFRQLAHYLYSYGDKRSCRELVAKRLKETQDFQETAYLSQLLVELMEEAPAGTYGKEQIDLAQELVTKKGKDGLLIDDKKKVITDDL